MEAVGRITWNLYKADNIRSVILLALLEVITIIDILEERLEKGTITYGIRVRWE